MSRFCLLDVSAQEEYRNREVIVISTRLPTLHNAVREELLRRTAPERQVHVMGVEGMAVVLATRWGVDLERTLLAALLHDIAKPLPASELRERLESCVAVAPSEDDRRFPAVWHGLVAAQEAHERYGVDDPEVLEAIAWHSTGAAKMASIGLTLYVADFIEPSRSWEGVEAVRQRLSTLPLLEATFEVATMKVERLRTEKKLVHPRTLEMLDWLYQTLAQGAPHRA